MDSKISINKTGFQHQTARSDGDMTRSGHITPWKMLSDLQGLQDVTATLSKSAGSNGGLVGGCGEGKRPCWTIAKVQEASLGFTEGARGLTGLRQGCRKPPKASTRLREQLQRGRRGWWRRWREKGERRRLWLWFYYLLWYHVSK